ncbi:50S ribosomal protein L4 [Acidiferrobacter sp.]|uniref:50S ribosomal protein L4 n=1 Tax=Acidiferrobacter sp. TaxID=1872107 RepID=UPI00341C4DB0
MKMTVVKASGGTGEMEISDDAFGVPFKEHLVHQIVVAYQAGGRAGTRAQKNRAAVSGSTRKPWAQKGGGRARAGNIRSPIWRGGGKTFPAATQDFSQKVNKKMRRAALRSILSELIRQDRLITVDEMQTGPKTKELLARLAAFGIGGRSPDVLIVAEMADDSLARAARNLYRVTVRPSDHVDPVSLIAHDKVLMTVGAMRKIEELLA